MQKNKKQNNKNDENSNVTMLQKKRGGHSAKTSETRLKFLDAFERTFGNISSSCQYAGISRLTYYRWMQSKTRINVKFQEKIKMLKPVEAQLDLAEAVLYANLKAGSLRAAEFILRTRGRERQYSEKILDFNYTLVLRAVMRLEKIFTDRSISHPDWKPDLKEFFKIAAEDFGVDVKDVEREFLKRQPNFPEKNLRS